MGGWLLIAGVGLLNQFEAIEDCAIMRVLRQMSRVENLDIVITL